MAAVNPERLRRILTRMLDEDEFLSQYGIGASIAWSSARTRSPTQFSVEFALVLSYRFDKKIG